MDNKEKQVRVLMMGDTFRGEYHFPPSPTGELSYYALGVKDAMNSETKIYTLNSSDRVTYLNLRHITAIEVTFVEPDYTKPQAPTETALSIIIPPPEKRGWFSWLRKKKK